MFKLTKINKRYGDKQILEDVNLCLYEEIVVLIGENGVGKTTLLKIMLGEVEADSGQILPRHAACGYVPQDPLASGTVGDGLPADAEVWRLEAALQDVGLDKPLAFKTNYLSGGEKTRLSIAYALAQNPSPNILLLDEPTNNLDAAALRWLEVFIKQFRGTVLIVSHNRDFINATCTKVLELENSKLKEYKGNYEAYKAQKELETKGAADAYAAYVKERRRLEKITVMFGQWMQQIDSKRYVKKPKETKTRLKEAKGISQSTIGRKMKALNSRLDQLEEPIKPDRSSRRPLNLEGDVRSSKLILKLEGITMQYQEVLFEGFSFNITGNQRLRISGKNGSGKSTLLKIVMGFEPPTAGTVKLGHEISIGYLSQEIDGLERQKTVLANLEGVTADKTRIHRETQALGLKPEELLEKPDRLSRGQQTKLSFCKLLLAEHDFLVLDEPTNHLDIPAREAIESSLRAYRGAMLIVSHDDYFVRAVGVTQEIDLDKKEYH